MQENHEKKRESADYFIRLGGKAHNLTPLVPHYGGKFCLRLIEAWHLAYALLNANTSEKHCGALRRFLLWMAAAALDNEDVNAVYTALQTESADQISIDQMRFVAELYVGKLRDLNNLEIVRTSNVLTRKPLIDALSSALQKLAAEGLWPDIGPIRGMGRCQLAGGNIRSLGELKQNLASHESGIKLLESHINEVMYLNAQRLTALREVLVTELLESHRAFKKGQDLLHKAQKLSPKFLRSIFEHKKGDVPPILRSWLKSDSADDEALMHLLAWLKVCRDGLVQTRDLPVNARQLISIHGGNIEITKHLEATGRGLLAAHTLLLIDTGFNVQTCDDLPANPFVGQVTRGEHRIATISARKRRAAGEIVEASMLAGTHNLDVKAKEGSISGVDVIRIWQEISEPIRRRASPEIAAKLWIIPSGRNNLGQVIRYDVGAFVHWWQNFLSDIASHPILGGLKFQRKMIRPTVLQVRTADNNFDHSVAQVLAGHKSSDVTVRRYLSAPWFKEKLDQLIRDFQNLYESSLASDIQEVATKLEIDELELLQRQQLAAETGLGFVCGARLPDAKQVRRQRSNCLSFDECATCPHRRFVPTAQSLKALALANISLKNQGAEFQAQNPDRWAEIWLPFLALTEAIISKIKKTHFRARLISAIEEITTDLEEHTIAEVRLW